MLLYDVNCKKKPSLDICMQCSCHSAYPPTHADPRADMLIRSYNDAHADLQLDCPHMSEGPSLYISSDIEGLVQDYSNMILQERVKTDLYSQLLCQYVSNFLFNHD